MTTVYVDPSALLKRVLVGPGSADVTASLRAWAADRDLVTSSSLAWVEVHRALRRAGEIVPGLDPGTLTTHASSGVAELPLDDQVLQVAQSIGGPLLRTLDAIHLASAVVAAADVLTTYDDRLAAAATAQGIAVSAPG